MLFRTILLLCSLLFSVASIAEDTSSTVLYPLPTQAEGKVFASKNLYLGDQGGIWIHDVHGRLVFFDGQNILPRTGSVLDNTNEQLAFLNNAFWSFVDNEIYRTYPNQERELIFSLTPGSSIQKIGSSGRYIWVTDDKYFYTYQVDTRDFKSYSLMELYQYNQSSHVTINDAQRVLSKWVLATNSGVYLSDNSTFSHIGLSNKHFVEKLYFSKARREILVGTLKGMIIIDLAQPDKPIELIGKGHVLSFTETESEYWVGTERGLFVYSFLSGELTELQSNNVNDFSLKGRKVYSLINDGVGGVWIATDRGIRYYSLYSKKFQRIPNHLLTSVSSNESITKILKNEQQEGYWLVSNRALYQVTLGQRPTQKVVYRRQVHDLVMRDGILWLATDIGIVCLDALTGKVIGGHLPKAIRTQPVEQIEISADGVLWGTKGEQLWSFDPKTNAFKDYGEAWLIDKYLPAKVTKLRSSEEHGLLIGTDHGVYQLKDREVRFVRESHNFGQVIDILSSRSGVWVAGAYGVYRFENNRDAIQAIELNEQNLSPRCLLHDDSGIWLTSSTGLSHYNESGHLRKHFGEPFGLLNNEFVAGLCDRSFDGANQLILGVRKGLIKVNADELLVDPLPEQQTLFSQISVNHQVLSTGNKPAENIVLSYGDSISFLLGILPESNTQKLLHQVEGDDRWTELEGRQLTLDHLLPGDYTIRVKRASLVNLDFETIEQSFTVKEPWYLTNLAVSVMVMVVLLFIAIVIIWRSRIIVATNKMLKAQVALKTNQLRHQSRILLTNNQQLRKQLEIRQLIYDQFVGSIQSKITSLLQSAATKNGMVESSALTQVSSELNILRDVKSDGTGTKQIHNLPVLIQTIIDGWRNEFTKADIELEFFSEQEDIHIELMNFNLDVVLNTLFDSALKRCFKSQVVRLELTSKDGRAVLKLIDGGKPFGESPSVNEDEVSAVNLAELVQLNDGSFNTCISQERNLIELSWKRTELETDNQHEPTTAPLEAQQSTIGPEQEWLQKVEGLVSNHYSDPDFGTASAAKLLFMSERSLQRRFKSATEKTFKEYLNEVRLERACQKLLNGEKVSDVAFDCGFNDPSYFSQRFKHHFGVPPTQFIETYEAD
ncbi:AraC family transcriptional regulator [Vibrio paucivorans]|uniref:Helix-turn-helix domain-containing protein n=1 Tax=Vibrio paucivorans TaxID=2829489 RepID=A0A9X3CCE0_9VIBR|nr:AraC family transcriptional regulator [Vibrio paucivorans]MCW8333076.1 helix-turn-helix domain-containing protein [Vibrio paucivorans]